MRLKRTFLMVLMTFLHAAIAHASDQNHPVIRGWEDVVAAMPSGQQVVAVADPSQYYVTAEARLEQRDDALLGWVATMPGNRFGWSIHWYTKFTSNPVHASRLHTVYVIARVARPAEKGRAWSMGMHPPGEGPVESEYVVESLRPGRWQLFKIGQCYPEKTKVIFIGSSRSAKIEIAGIVLASDYEPQVGLKGYLTPNGDGLNDSLPFRFWAGLNKAVSLEVLDSKDRTIRRWESFTSKDNPLFSETWEGLDASGQYVAAGSYSLRVRVQERETRLGDAVLVQDTAPLPEVNQPQARQDHFLMGVFHDASNLKSIPADIQGATQWYDTHFQKLSEDGFNCVQIVWPRAGHDQIILKMAQKHGLVVYMTTRFYDLGASDPVGKPRLTETYAMQVARSVAERYRNYPALAGYIIADEPQFDKLDNWVTMQRAMQQVDPLRPVVTCFNNRAALQVTARMTSMASHTMDLYMIYPNSHLPSALNWYARGVEHLTELNPDKPAWIIGQAYGGQAGLRMPTPAEIRAMTWLSVVHGTRGHIYFLWQTMPHINLHGLIDDAGKATPQYEEASKMATMIQTLSPLLMDLKPVATQAKVSAGHEMREHVDSQGQRYLIVVNMDVAGSSRAEIRLPVSSGVQTLTDALTSQSFSRSQGAFRVELHAGEGKVLKLNP